MKSRNLFLGIIILFIGVMSLLASLDVISFSWRIVWKLWPMLLVFTGIVILPIKDWLKALLLVVALAVGVWLYQAESKKTVVCYDTSWVGSVRQWWDEIYDDFFDLF